MGMRKKVAYDLSYKLPSVSAISVEQDATGTKNNERREPLEERGKEMHSPGQR